MDPVLPTPQPKKPTGHPFTDYSHLVGTRRGHLILKRIYVATRFDQAFCLLCGDPPQHRRIYADTQCCACGKFKRIRLDSILSGRTVSCGCIGAKTYLANSDAATEAACTPEKIASLSKAFSKLKRKLKHQHTATVPGTRTIEVTFRGITSSLSVACRILKGKAIEYRAELAKIAKRFEVAVFMIGAACRIQARLLAAKFIEPFEDSGIEIWTDEPFTEIDEDFVATYGTGMVVA